MKKGDHNQSVSLEFLGLRNFFVCCTVLYFYPEGKGGEQRGGGNLLEL